MNQPTPIVTDADVERIVRRDFPAELYAAVMTVLSEYGKEDWQREQARVRLAVLKLANGKLDALRREMSVATCDYRDVLSPAEYPAYRKKVSGSEPATAEQQRFREQVIQQDWQQYEKWLYR